MPPKLAARSASLLGLALLFACAVPFAFMFYAPEELDYGVSLTAEIAQSVYLGTALSIAAAVRAIGLRNGGVFARGSVRPPLVILLNAIWPLFAFGLVAHLLVVLVGGAFAGFRIALGILGVSLVVLMAQILFGAWVGLVLAPMRALIVLLVVPLAWMLVPGWAKMPLVNQLNGQFAGCCTGAETYSRTAAWGSLLVGVGVLAAILVAIALLGATRTVGTDGVFSGEARRRSAAVAIAVPVVVAVAALVIPPDTTGWAATAKRADDTRCFDGTPEICLRPEHVDDLPEVRAALRELEYRWGLYGVPLPKTVSEAGGVGRVRFQYGPDHTRDIVKATIALNSVPSAESCYQKPLPPVHDRPLVAAVDHLTVWLTALTGGLTTDEVREWVSDPANMQEAWDVRNLTNDAQAAWYREQVAVIESCGGRDA
ncbi:DUF7224 domain-containing protein [Cryptosporangium aurantiacum]|uniref:DUF7224 domain-containing protein n=1 Tax=Cryptosporangium aurantiacum TaxID=134849 RepID=A0A1M7KYR4_9ACTN|nr:hypothetical protein [Cryptosporangium aurantiacum]SHM70774.1 hypothetical protein SAMN05443668_1011302 [Cryptosporangium aurantiacum]